MVKRKKVITYRLVPVYENFDVETLDSDNLKQVECVGLLGPLHGCYTTFDNDYLSNEILDFLKDDGLRKLKDALDIQQYKIRVYEQFLHSLNMYAAIVMDGQKVKKLIDNACRWSYAHRAGNGELTEEEQDNLITNAFGALNDVE